MEIKAKHFLSDYKECLESGIRPVKILVCSREDGGLYSYEIRNSKSIFPDVDLNTNEYVVFVDKNGRHTGALYDNSEI